MSSVETGEKEVLDDSEQRALHQALDELAKILGETNPEEKGTVGRVRLLLDIKKIQEIKDHIAQNGDSFKKILLSTLQNGQLSLESSRALLSLVSENVLLEGVYQQYGVSHGVNSSDRGTGSTDCVQILRKSPAFKALLAENPLRTFDSGADLVFDEKLGKIVDVVDRRDFARLTQFKPDQDHFYVFGLANPPLVFQGKPNITHLQIPNSLHADAEALSVIHASPEQGKVVFEENVLQYLATRPFERVFVFEVDVRQPFAAHMSGREPNVKARDHEGKNYERPSVYNLPVVKDDFTLIGSEKTIPIYEEEKRTLELITPDNRVLEYLTLLTGMREGKIGPWQNRMESTAFSLRETIPSVASIPLELGRQIFVDKTNPEWKSLGLNQVTKTVLPLFNTWIEDLSEHTARQLGPELTRLWEGKRAGQSIEWEDLMPFLNSYDVSTDHYQNVQISTICSYLLIKHLYEDQLMGAYRAYGEPFFGLEEEPSALIALASAYRSNVDVMVTGGQQYRVAELAYQLGFLNSDFEFTDKAKQLPFFSDYQRRLDLRFKDPKQQALFAQKFQVDGYRGIQTQYVAYFCYLASQPDPTKAPLAFAEFEHAYGTSQHAMLDRKNPAVEAIRSLYKKKLGHEAQLLMDEGELRGESTPLKTLSIDFANEGLWVLSHYKKLVRENWDAIRTQDDASGHNPLLEQVLEARSDRTNDVSKIPVRDGLKLAFALHTIPGNPWYLQYPEPLLAACVCNQELNVLKIMNYGTSRSQEQWLKRTQDFVRNLFEVNVSQIETATGESYNEKERVAIAVASSQIDLEWIVAMLKQGIPPLELTELYSQQNPSHREVNRLVHFQRSFYLLGERFRIRDPLSLEKKEELSEKEEREKFALNIYDFALQEALNRGYGKDFALVATAQACLETGWGDRNNLLVKNARNLFSIKANYEEYTEEEYKEQDETADFLIVQTYEGSSQDKKHVYEAFKKYASFEESVTDYFDLLERVSNYTLAIEIAQSAPSKAFFNKETQTAIAEAVVKGGFATDPEYFPLVTSVAKSVEEILLRYGVDM